MCRLFCYGFGFLFALRWIEINYKSYKIGAYFLSGLSLSFWMFVIQNIRFISYRIGYSLKHRWITWIARKVITWSDLCKHLRIFEGGYFVPNSCNFLALFCICCNSFLFFGLLSKRSWAHFHFPSFITICVAYKLNFLVSTRLNAPQFKSIAIFIHLFCFSLTFHSQSHYKNHNYTSHLKLITPDSRLPHCPKHNSHSHWKSDWRLSIFENPNVCWRRALPKEIHSIHSRL